MKNAIFAIISIVVMFIPAMANSESRVVFQEDGHACRLDYDSGFFKRSSLDSDHHRRFLGPNANTYFRVTALANDKNMTLGKIRKDYLLERGQKDLVYDRVTGNFLVLSGYRGKSIFYTKIALSPDKKTVCVLDIFYPRESKRAFDPQVTRMSHSFAAQN